MFAAVIALSQQHERAISPAVVYYAAAIIDGRVLAETEAVKVFWSVVVLVGLSISATG